MKSELLGEQKWQKMQKKSSYITAWPMLVLIQLQENADIVIQLCADQCSSPNISLLEHTTADFCSLILHIYWIGTDGLVFVDFSTCGP